MACDCTSGSLKKSWSCEFGDVSLHCLVWSSNWWGFACWVAGGAHSIYAVWCLQLDCGWNCESVKCLDSLKFEMYNRFFVWRCFPKLLFFWKSSKSTMFGCYVLQGRRCAPTSRQETEPVRLWLKSIGIAQSVCSLNQLVIKASKSFRFSPVCQEHPAYHHKVHN